jgi:hypothetical protein
VKTDPPSFHFVRHGRLIDKRDAGEPKFMDETSLVS